MIIYRIDEGEPRKEIEVLRCIVSHIAQATLCHAVIACSRPWAESMYDSLIKGEQTSQWSLRLRWKPWYVLLTRTPCSPVFCCRRTSALSSSWARYAYSSGSQVCKQLSFLVFRRQMIGRTC